MTTEPQGLATDKKILFERPSKRKNVAMSLATKGLRCVTHEGIGVSCPSNSNRALDTSDTLKSTWVLVIQCATWAAFAVCSVFHLSDEELTPNIAVRTTAFHKQKNFDKRLLLQLVYNSYVQNDGFFSFRCKPGARPPRRYQTWIRGAVKEKTGDAGLQQLNNTSIVLRLCLSYFDTPCAMNSKIDGIGDNGWGAVDVVDDPSQLGVLERHKAPSCIQAK